MPGMKIEFDKEKLIKNNQDLDNNLDLVIEWIDMICKDAKCRKIGDLKYIIPDNKHQLWSLLFLSMMFDKHPRLIKSLKIEEFKCWKGL